MPLQLEEVRRAHMTRFDGSLARQLDFGEITTTTFPAARPLKARLRLSSRPETVRGPDKYKVLEQRRHQAQIKARRLLGLF
jgi:hypothetical protein